MVEGGKWYIVAVEREGGVWGEVAMTGRRGERDRRESDGKRMRVERAERCIS